MSIVETEKLMTVEEYSRLPNDGPPMELVRGRLVKSKPRSESVRVFRADGSDATVGGDDKLTLPEFSSDVHVPVSHFFQ